MRRGVLLPLLDVLPGPVGWNDPLEGRLEVPGDRRVGVLVDRHPGRRVRHVDERGRALPTGKRFPHEPGDVDELALPLGLYLELDHVVV